MIDNHFYRIYNLIEKYYEIRKKEIKDIFHDEMKCEELIIKLSESRNNILSDKTKRILINKIKNEVDYIKRFLLKKEYKQKLEYDIFDYDYYYEVMDGYNHLFNYFDVQDRLKNYLVDADEDDDEVYKIVSKNKK